MGRAGHSLSGEGAMVLLFRSIISLIRTNLSCPRLLGWGVTFVFCDLYFRDLLEHLIFSTAYNIFVLNV